MVIHESGRVHTFRVYLPQAEHVELVGSFTDWRNRPVRMLKESSGWWSACVELPPGDHDFNYLVNHATWVADYAANGIRRNTFGGWVSLVHVPEFITETAPALRMAA
jgi:1,4-alpha-glucan branching enzyme